MKRACFVCLFSLLIATFLLSQSNPVSSIDQSARVTPPISTIKADSKVEARIMDNYGKLPLSFEANHGQIDAPVKFLSRTGGYTLFLTGDEAVLALSGKKASPNKGKIVRAAHASQPVTEPKAGGVLRMKLRNASPSAKVSGADELAGTSNYFIGNDPAQWSTKVPTYAKVKYEGIYSGIDLVYYGNQRQLEYDFIVAPGADPRRIAFDVSGANRIRKDKHGDLAFKVGEQEIRWHKPVVYQEKDGARQEIAADYAITDTNRVGFEVAKYDTDRPLYIDPVVDRLIYSTYLGGSAGDTGYGIAVDSGGNAYVTGLTGSSDFPTMDPLQPALGGSGDVFVTKINPAGSALVYSTYLGGSGHEYGVGIAVDGAGNAYVTGLTSATDFPTKNPLQAAYGGGAHDAFVAKINPAGSALVYSTYLGGSGDDQSYGIAADSAGNAYVTGSTDSTNFPTTPGAFQTVNRGEDAFVSKISSSGSALVYSTYLGGSNIDIAFGIAVDSAGNAYVTGTTGSSDFPTTPGAYLRTCFSQCDYGEPFATKVNSTGSALVYSTYLGGKFFDTGYGIALDSADNAYILVFRSLRGYLAVLYKVNAAGSSAVNFIDPIKKSQPYGIAMDSSGSVYVTGDGGLVKGAFIYKFNSAGKFVSSVYLQGNGDDPGYAIAVDSSNRAYVTGYTDQTDFPTKNPFQPTFGGGPADAYVAKIDMGAATTTTISSSPNPSIYGQTVIFTAVVSSSLGAPADGETVTFMKGTTVLGTGTISSGSASFSTSTLKVGSNAIKAAYGGDSNLFGSTSKVLKAVVNKASTTTALVSSQNPSSSGQPVTFTATVTPQFSGTPDGKVTFSDGTTVLKTVVLNGGVAQFTTSTLAVGAHTITAAYAGSANFNGSSASLTQTVN